MWSADALGGHVGGTSGCDGPLDGCPSAAIRVSRAFSAAPVFLVRIGGSGRQPVPDREEHSRRNQTFPRDPDTFSRGWPSKGLRENRKTPLDAARFGCDGLPLGSVVGLVPACRWHRRSPQRAVDESSKKPSRSREGMEGIPGGATGCVGLKTRRFWLSRRMRAIHATSFSGGWGLVHEWLRKVKSRLRPRIAISARHDRASRVRRQWLPQMPVA
jgi:hypothetical protein